MIKLERVAFGMMQIMRFEVDLFVHGVTTDSSFVPLCTDLTYFLHDLKELKQYISPYLSIHAIMF